MEDIVVHKPEQKQKEKAPELPAQEPKKETAKKETPRVEAPRAEVPQVETPEKEKPKKEKAKKEKSKKEKSKEEAPKKASKHQAVLTSFNRASEEEDHINQLIPQATTFAVLAPFSAESEQSEEEGPPAPQTTWDSEVGHALAEEFNAGDPEIEKTKGRFGVFKKSGKSKEEESPKDSKAGTTPRGRFGAEAHKIHGSIKHMQENIPDILHKREKPSGSKDEALEHEKEATELSEDDQFGAPSRTIMEIPAGARVHSLSHDTILISKAPQEPHRLSKDRMIPSAKAASAHALGQDKVVQSKSTPQAHRLSADAMGPRVSGRRQMLSHELLDDPTVRARSKSPLPHTLESDKRVVAATRAADEFIERARSKRSHDISKDVRVLSPSGRVLALHAVDDDDTGKKTARYPKSPHPNAIPGTWVVTASGTQQCTCGPCLAHPNHASSVG